MQPNLGQRIAEERARQFVGREGECGLLRSALFSSEMPFYILYLHGPGGVGKTSLLHVFSALCGELHVPFATLDARNVEPSPTAFIEALRAALDLAPAKDPIAFLEQVDARLVLLLDTFEMLDGMQEWLRDFFLPHISTNVLLIVAGRQPPANAPCCAAKTKRRAALSWLPGPGASCLPGRTGSASVCSRKNKE